MASPVEIVGYCLPANMPTERDSKKQKLEEEFPDDNKQAAEDSDSDDDYNLDHYDGDVELMNQYKLMYKQARRSEGFEVTTFPSKYLLGAATYMQIEDDTPIMYGRVKRCLASAIKDYNKCAKDDEKIEVLDIVRAIRTGASIIKYFITINARLICSDERKLYQVKVVHSLVCNETKMVFVRPKPGQ